MGKILALDLGDQWVGTAISDTQQILARPYSTTTQKQLIPFLTSLCAQEKIDTVVIGCPTTLRGTISAQTQKVIDEHASLSKQFPDIPFVLWDERLTSKRAQALVPARSKEEKIKSHSRAAAFILDSYLAHLAYKRENG